MTFLIAHVGSVESFLSAHLVHRSIFPNPEITAEPPACWIRLEVRGAGSGPLARAQYRLGVVKVSSGYRGRFLRRAGSSDGLVRERQTSAGRYDCRERLPTQGPGLRTLVVEASTLPDRVNERLLRVGTERPPFSPFYRSDISYHFSVNVPCSVRQLLMGKEANRRAIKHLHPQPLVITPPLVKRGQKPLFYRAIRADILPYNQDTGEAEDVDKSGQQI